MVILFNMLIQILNCILTEEEEGEEKKKNFLEMSFKKYVYFNVMSN